MNGETWQRDADYLLLQSEIIYRMRRPWGNTREEFMILTNQNIGTKRGDLLQETSKAVCLGLIAFKLTYKLQTSPDHNIGSISNHIFTVGFILY